MWEVIKKNPISAFAVLVTTAIGIFLGYMILWQTEILASPTWCAKAMGAEKAAPGQTYQQAMEALKSCNNLLMVQLESLATDSHIDHGVIGTVIIVLIVVVIAGARASWKLGMQGLEGSVGREAAAADRVATAAVNEAAEVKDDAKVGAKPDPNYNGPAMPPPPTKGS